MDKLYLIFGLIIAIGLSGFFLIVRKTKWCSDFLRFTITGLFFIIGIVGLATIDNLTKNQRLFFIWIQIPLVNSLVDRLFKFLSFKIHNRDLWLYMRGSADLDFANKNVDLKTSDYIFSIILIILLFVLPLIGF